MLLRRFGSVIDTDNRRFLDMRREEAHRYLEERVIGLLKRCGFTYIKVDYNDCIGIGCDDPDSPGEGLRKNMMGTLRFFRRMREAIPDLVIENCSSGGLRMDYAMLSRYSIQSTSDVEDYRYYATIAANAPSVLTPEQAAMWSYPLADGDDEQTAFNMVNAMMLRIHQSGHLAQINPSGKKLVKEGIRTYKRMRNDIRKSFAFWPLGLSDYDDPWVSLGLRTERTAYVAVWRRNSSDDTVVLPIEFLNGRKASAELLYPANAPCEYSWNPGTSSLTVRLPELCSARIFRIRF